jgi:large subunit ribosomal protein L19
MALKGQELIRKVTQPTQALQLDKLQPGDTVVVSIRVKEGEKERLQNFKGVVIALKGRGATRSFTVRKIAAGNIGVERTFPFSSPALESVTRVSTGKVRRSKLYYLRDLSGKKARLKNELLMDTSSGSEEGANSENTQA